MILWTENQTYVPEQQIPPRGGIFILYRYLEKKRLPKKPFTFI